MTTRDKGTAKAKAPGDLGLDYLGDIAKPTVQETKPSRTDDLTSASSEAVASASPDKGSSAKRASSRASKHHVSLYVSPAVDRAMKRIALDEEVRPWEAYHAALREYLDRHGQSFDSLMGS